MFAYIQDSDFFHNLLKLKGYIIILLNSIIKN